NRTVALHPVTLDRMPVVTGLFTNLDLRSGDAPRVSVETRAYATSQTLRQIVAAALAAVLALTTVFLLARSRPVYRLLKTLRPSLRSVWDRGDTTDFVVVGVLVVWWIVAPTLFDDGWVWVSHRLFGDVGTMNVYFDMWGINWPTGYWLEWLRHWASGSTTALIFARLPS